MLQNSKHVLFDEQHKLKLENPEMSLEAWKGHIDERKCIFRVEKVISGKTALGGKRYGYKVSTQDPLWPNCEPATRSRADFHLLQMQLEKRFPNAVVPRIFKKEVDNLHMMELYLTELSLNQFFRMDVSFSDFLNGKFREYKQTKKNDRKHSQGTLRWLQQTTEYSEIDSSEDFLKGLKADLDQYERSQKNLIKTLDVNAKALMDLQSATATVSTGLGELLAVELSSENKGQGSASGLAPGRLKGLLEKLIQLNQDHQSGLKQAYDGGSLDRLAIQPIIIELRNLTALRKVVEILAAAKKDFDTSKASFDAIPNEDPQKEKAKEALMYKDVFYFKQRRALGYQLERYRTYRTIRFQEFFQAYTKFNLRGANRITEEWSKSGLKLEPNEEAEFFKMDRIYAENLENPVGKPGRGRSGSVNQTSKRGSRAPVDLKSLIVVNNVHPRMGSKYLKLAEGELVTGHQVAEGGDYYVTTSTGQKGFVKAVNVDVHKGGPPPKPVAPQKPFNTGSINNQSAASGFPSALPVYSGGDDEERDDWSVSSEGANNDDDGFGASAKTMPKPTAPQPPGLPPGLSSFNPISPGMANPGPKPPQEKSSTPPAMKSFSPPVPTQAASTPTFNQPIINNAPTPINNGFIPQGMNNPGAPPSMPTFGAPGAMPQMPTFGGAPNGGGAPLFTPNSNAPKPPASKPAPMQASKKNGGGGGGAPKLGGAMPSPPGPGGRGRGGLAFLADIKKPNAVALNKVPDAEKSKEIGGDKGKGPAGAVVDGPSGGGGGGGNGGGRAAPPMGGGGGGMMGELAAKLNRRR